MAQGFYTWSMSAAANANADATIDWREGMAPSAVNDSARAVMARLCEWRNDISGITVTDGTSTAYTITTNQVFGSLPNLSNQMVAFVPNATNTNTVGNDVTLNVDGLGAKPIRIQPSVALPNGTLILGTPYVVTYNNTDAVFYLQGMTNPYIVPLGSVMDYAGATAPNSAFVLSYGQAISRTTYATLFSILSTTYGTGDGSTTFNVPDLRGRVVAGKDDMGGSSADRLTAVTGGINGDILGNTGGGESQTLTLAQLPTGITAANASQAISVSSTNIIPSSASWVRYDATSSGAVNVIGNATGVFSFTNQPSTGSNSISVTSNNTSGTAHNIVQPTMILNKILRVI